MDQIEQRIQRYDRILSHEVWTKTPLLNVLAGRLRAMLKRLRDSQTVEQKEKASENLVYVLLYHQQGGQLSIWEDMLKKIAHSLTSRPIFRDEQRAKQMIRNSLKEGYVVLDVPPKSLLSMDGQLYLRPEDLGQMKIKSFYWRGKTFHFNGLALIERNSFID